MQGDFKKLIKKSRPIFWAIMPIFSLGGFLLSGASFSPLYAVQFLLLSFPFSLFLYGINDVFDYESDLVNARKQQNLGGAAADKKMHKILIQASFVVVAIFMLSSIITLNIYNIVASGVLVFLSFFYSAPPIRIKTKPPLDSLTNGLLYVILPFIIGYSYSGDLSNFPIKMIYVALCGVSMHALAAVPDIEADKQVGDKTIATTIGGRGTIFLNVLVYVCVLIFGNFSSIFINVFMLLIVISGLLLISTQKTFEKHLFSYLRFIFYSFFVVTAIELVRYVL